MHATIADRRTNPGGPTSSGYKHRLNSHRILLLWRELECQGLDPASREGQAFIAGWCNGWGLTELAMPDLLAADLRRFYLAGYHAHTLIPKWKGRR